MISSSSSSSGEKRKFSDEKKLPVDCSASTESLWLVKLPEFLGDFVSEQPHDAVIGRLKVRKIAPSKANPKGGKSTSVELTGTDDHAGIPSSYSLEDKSIGDDVSMLAFSEQFDGVPSEKNNNSKTASKRSGYTLHGSVTKSMILRPDGADYNKLLRDRSVKTYMRREIQVDNNAIFNFNNMNHIVNFKPSEAAVLKRQAEEADRANRKLGDDDGKGMAELRRKVFEAFSKTERIKQADLQAFCSSCSGYTSARVRDILDACARYHQKGTYKHFWELSPEYRASTPLKEGES